MTWRMPPYNIAVAEIEQHVRATYRRGMLQPHRKAVTRGLAAVDLVAAQQLRAFTTATGEQALQIAIGLANHVLGVDTFFAWTSDRS